VSGAASPAASSPPALGPSLASLITAATNLFPVFVLGAAVLGLAQPTCFDWFLPSYMTPALGVTMLGMGLTLTFDVGTRIDFGYETESADLSDDNIHHFVSGKS